MIPNVARAISNIFGGGRSGPPRSAGSLENPSVDINDPDLWEAMGSRKSASGMNVGPEDCLRFGPVYQCLEIKSADIGAAPLHCHKNEVEPGKDDIDYNQSCERVCSLVWNEVTPANEGWQNLVFHQQLYGGGYAYIARQGGTRNGPIRWMANLVPDRVKPIKDETVGLLYELKLSNGQCEYLNPWEVFHLRGISLTPMNPLKPFELMRDELGLALAARQWLSKLFERGGHHGGILEIPAGTKQKAIDNLEKGVAKRADPSSWFKTMVLRDGAKWQSATIDPRTAQMSELTEDEARAVCHFLNMPPWKIGLRNSESYNSAEQAALNYVRGTLLHVSTRIRGEATIKLLSERTLNARSHRFEHDFTALLATDIKSLNEILERQRQNEVITANEWRDRINMPRMKDPRADQLYNPNTKAKDATGNGTATTDTAKTATTSAAAATAATTIAPLLSEGREGSSEQIVPRVSDAGTPGKLRDSMRRVLTESGARAAKRLTTIAKNKSRKSAEFLAWVDACAAEHVSVVTEETASSLEASLEAASSLALVPVLQLATNQWFTSQIAAGVKVFLDPPHKAGDLEKNVETWCGQWAKSAGEQWIEQVLLPAIAAGE